MSRPYQPAPWLTNPHLHTVWGRLFRRRLVLPFHRARWNTPDDDFVDLLRLDGTSPDHPILLLLHGLEGSPSSPYISGTLQYALRRGWHACALFFRTCGGEMNRRQRSYHSGETSDLDFVIRRLTLERPQRPIVLVGMSLGGNVLLKWLGEQGSLLPPQVRAATAVSTPFDLARSCRHIDQTAGRFYSRRFLRSLRRKALEKIARYPSIADADAVRRAESLWEFDNAFTSVVHGFENAADYYSRCSSLGFLNSICVPTLLLSAFDDPFHPPDVLHQVAAIAETNPWLSTEFVDIGGHVGFIEGATPWRTSSYGERRPVEFADTCLSGLRLAGAD